MKIEVVKSGAPRPLANYSEAMVAGPWIFAANFQNTAYLLLWNKVKLLPAEAFLLIAENSLAMAARYQPELTNRETGEKQPNPNNEER